ncbi:MAG: ferredoxin--NADP reductase [Candidatus Dojkabacteria bacterium]
MAVKNFKAEVSLKEEVAKNTYRLEMSVPKGDSFDFTPGQFVNLLVAPNTRRSYSIASLPNGNGFETYANTNAGGPGSKFFESVKVGDKVEVLGPLGKFVYTESDRPVKFFATGTGVTPFISMIGYALEIEKTTRPIMLFLGFRHEEDVFPKDMLDEFKKAHDNFDYEICISKPTDEWEGRKGRITLCIVDIHEKDVDAYICGSQGMINDVQQRLVDLGIPDDQIYYEQFY